MQTVEEAKKQVIAEVEEALKTTGVRTYGTCVNGEVHGWNMPLHYALSALRRNPPKGWHIECHTNWECQDWTITAE
jgi:hypothetical protein